MPNIDRLGPLEKPPDLIRKIYKFYQKQTPDALKHDSDIVDFDRGIQETQHCILK